MAFSDPSGNSGIASIPGPSTSGVMPPNMGGNQSMQNMSGSAGTMPVDTELDGADTLNPGEVAACNSDRNTGIGNLTMRTREHF
jgi:hypothetical protein